MKKNKILAGLVLLAALLLPACSAPVAAIQSQASEALQKASELIAPEAPVQLQEETKALAPAQAPAPTATPGQPVVQLPANAAGLIAAYEGALTQIYETVNPSVVNIRVLTRASGLSAGGGMPQIPGLPFDFGPFGGDPNQQAPDNEAQPYAQGQGSGFVWDKQGHIVTNNHVVEGAEKIEVTFSDGMVVPAELVGADKDSDLAVIKVDVDADLLKPVQLADSRQVKVGEIAIAIGNPYGLEGSMTVGIVSAVGRTTPGGESQMGAPGYSIPDVIQTDAPINPGNSGGPLVDDQGRVVGVTYMIESASGANSGIGFVIPASLVSRVVPSLIENGSYQHPYLGISGISLSPAIAEAMDLDPMQRGVMVGDVNPDGPAGKAGLQGSSKTAQIEGQQIQVGGDVIIAIEGTPVNSMDDLIAYLANSTTVGQQVTLTILRDGKETGLDVTLEARPTTRAEELTIPAMPRSREGAQSDRPWMGITAGSLIPAIAEAMGLPSDQTGVLIEQVANGSPASEAGLRGSSDATTINGQPVMIGGDVIIAIDDEPVVSMEDLSTLLGKYKPGDQITLTILRDGKQMEVKLTLGSRSAIN